MQEKEKVYLFTTLSLTGGGTERVAAVLPSELADLGYETHLLVYRRAKKEYPTSDELNIHYLDEGWQGGNPVKRLQENTQKITELLKEIKPDYIINLVGDMSLFQMYLATKRYVTYSMKQTVEQEVTSHNAGSLPVFIASIRNHPRKAYRGMKFGFLKNQIHLALTRRADACFMQTTEQLNYFEQAVKDKSFVLSNPVDEQFFEAHYEGHQKIQRIITMGRLNQQKNQKLLLEGFARAIEKEPLPMKDVELCIYGEGEERGNLEKKIQMLKLTDKAKLCGRTIDSVRTMEEADLFILSSDYEGMPNALMEAMAVGMPVISTDCPTGPADMIKDKENGILIPMKDVEALADAITYMVEHPKKAFDYGQKARELAKSRYLGEVIARELVAQCEKLDGK